MPFKLNSPAHSARKKIIKGFASRRKQPTHGRMEKERERDQNDIRRTAPLAGRKAFSLNRRSRKDEEEPRKEKGVGQPGKNYRSKYVARRNPRPGLVC